LYFHEISNYQLYLKTYIHYILIIRVARGITNIRRAKSRPWVEGYILASCKTPGYLPPKTTLGEIDPMSLGNYSRELIVHHLPTLPNYYYNTTVVVLIILMMGSVLLRSAFGK